MDQQISASLPILLITIKDMFILVTLDMNTKTHRALALICRKLLTFYNDCVTDQDYTLLCDLQFDRNLISKYMEALRRNWSCQINWNRTKANIKMGCVSEMDNCIYPLIRGLCLKEPFTLPKNLNYAAIDDITLQFLDDKGITPSISFLEKFPNLKSLRLENATFNDALLLTISERSLHSLSLNACTMADYVPKMVETCITIKDFQLLYCNYNRKTITKLHPQCERFITMTDAKHEPIDLSDCIQLSHLEIFFPTWRGSVKITHPHKVLSLRNVKLNCPVDPFCSNDSLNNSETITLCWENINYYRTPVSELTKDFHTNHRNLNFENFKCIKKICIVDPPLGNNLSCRFPSGTGSIDVVLIWGDTWTILTFKLCETSIDVHILIEYPK